MLPTKEIILDNSEFLDGIEGSVSSASKDYHIPVDLVSIKV
jgi:hypothetical protein